MTGGGDGGDVVERATTALARAELDGETRALIAELAAALVETRALADERWQAISKLAPAAKARRGQAQDLARLAREAALALHATEPALAARLAAAATAALPADADTDGT